MRRRFSPPCSNQAVSACVARWPMSRPRCAPSPSCCPRQCATSRRRTTTFRCASDKSRGRAQPGRSLRAFNDCPCTGSDRQLQGGEFSAVNVGAGSFRARQAEKGRPFAVCGRAVSARQSAVQRIADTHGGTGRRAGCRLDGADPAYAQRRRLAPHAALPPLRPSESDDFKESASDGRPHEVIAG